MHIRKQYEIDILSGKAMTTEISDVRKYRLFMK